MNNIIIRPEQAGILGKHVLCAVSGGADSVALLVLLCRLRDAGDIALTAAHFEHGIRGAASVEDREFVGELCKKLRVSCEFGGADVPTEAAAAREGLETCARRLRHAFLRGARERVGADVIALAHHADDQAETVLMHLLRGGGLKGAAGMREIDGFIVRPLLSATKRRLIDFLTSIGQDWREDETNLDVDTPRNIIRNLAMPSLTRAYPGAVSALSRFSAIAACEDEFMQGLTEQVFSERVSDYAGIACVSLKRDLDLALLRRLVRMIFPKLDFIELERACTASGRVTLSGDMCAWRARDTLYLLPPFRKPKPAAIERPGEYELDGVCRLTIAPAKTRDVAADGSDLTQTLGMRALEGCVLRLREPGDVIRPLGMGGNSKLLSNYLTDRKFPYPLRSRLPLICRGPEVMWACGVGISETAKLADDCEAARAEIRLETGIGGYYSA